MQMPMLLMMFDVQLISPTIRRRSGSGASITPINDPLKLYLLIEFDHKTVEVK
jgi:hypothetical protein